MIDFSRHLDVTLGRDGELGLLPPARELFPLIVESSRHELCRKLTPHDADMTEAECEKWIEKSPLGRNWGSIDKVPVYWLCMVLFDETGQPAHVVGTISVHVALTRDDSLFDWSNFGYRVLPQFRGRHYAARSVRLALPLLRAHGVEEAWITCNPANIASRRSCELAGAQLIDEVEVDKSNPRGELFPDARFCRYKLKVG